MEAPAPAPPTNPCVEPALLRARCWFRLLLGEVGRSTSPSATRNRTRSSTSRPSALLPTVALSADAAKVPPPDFKTVPLKDAADFKLIGKPTKAPRHADQSGWDRRQFGLDARCPGMLYAVVARCPVFGGKVASFDATKAKAVPGVKDVVQIKSGVAVVADNTWSALQGRKALDIQWDEGPAASLNSAGIFKLFAQTRAAQTGVAARKVGDAPAVLAAAPQKIDAVYQAPYVAHCAMEPLNCTADVRADSAEIWAPTQFQTTGQAIAAKILGLKPEAVILHTTFLGGGFGRKGNNDDLAEAVQISKAVGKPVKVTWSREDDTQHDFYRPASYCAFSSTLDADGKITALSSSIACGSVVNSFFPGSITNGLDPQSVEGIADTEYDIPNLLVNYQLTDTAIPVGFWRSVGTSQNGFFLESYIDELAAAAKKDPYEFRRQLLAKAPRRLAVLNLAAQKAGWGTPLPPGRYRGIAVLEAFQTYVAQVAEVSVDQKARTYRVHRVVCAIDCGQVVNPATIQAQMQGSVAFAMSMLKQEITIDRGRVQQTNFNNFPALRMNEMPVVEGHIVPSTEKPTGVGEPNVPCLAPAVCNAIFAATGKRIRRLPIRPEDLA